jgi:ubiquinone/menaquinone biosynthesis C-methylase UbiE
MQKDYFGYEKQSESYDAFRPKYPNDLISKLASLTLNKKVALDVGTGTGILAYPLSSVFDKVVAIDSSEKQLKIPQEKYSHISKLIFKIGDAHKLIDSFDKNEKVDLITVGQAFHWFDKDLFLSSCKSVLNSDGVVALCGYNMFKILNNSELQKVVDIFYDKVKPYFKCNRTTLELEYQDIEFDVFKQEHFNFEHIRKSDLDSLLNYLDTFSAYRVYKETFENENNYIDPLVELKLNINKIDPENKIGSIEVSTMFFLKALYFK